MPKDYLPGIIKLFEYYKSLGEKTLNIIPEEKINWQYNESSNSIATIVKHISGNMLSRFTDFLTTDGEKEWRNREEEFAPKDLSKQEVLARWNQGWKVFLEVLHELKEEDLDRIIYIRNLGQTVTDALNRQLAHYASHVGQIIFLGKLIMDKNWISLSIPKGESDSFNAQKFSEPKREGHFTDEYMLPGKKD